MKISSRPGLESVIPIVEEEMGRALEERKRFGFSIPRDFEIRICYRPLPKLSSSLQTNASGDCLMWGEIPIIFLNLLNFNSFIRLEMDSSPYISEYVQKLKTIPFASPHKFSKDKEDLHFHILENQAGFMQYDVEETEKGLRKKREEYGAKTELGDRELAENFKYCVENCRNVMRDMTRMASRVIESLPLNKSFLNETLMHEVDHADFSYSPLSKRHEKVSRAFWTPNPAESDIEEFFGVVPISQLLFESRAYCCSPEFLQDRQIERMIEYLETHLIMNFHEIDESIHSEISQGQTRYKLFNELSRNYAKALNKLPETIREISSALDNPPRLALTTQAESYDHFMNICYGNAVGKETIN
jgi:hypothetical protein